MTKSILAQVLPAINTLVDIYKVPANISSVVTNILITNHDTLATFSLLIAVNAETTSAKQYWFKDCEILANETIDLDLALIMNSLDTIRASSSNGNISFNILGNQTL